MTSIPTTAPQTGLRAARASLVGAAVLLTAMSVPLAGAQAKEVGSGGTGGTGGTSTCNPVSSLTAKADPRVGETGLASIAVSYSVKPCVNNQAVMVDTSVYEYFDPTAVAFDDPAAPLNGKFTAFGIKLRTSYVVRVAVSDAVTGTPLGSLQVSAAAVPKGV